jgi:hypothetical protein
VESVKFECGSVIQYLVQVKLPAGAILWQRRNHMNWIMGWFHFLSKSASSVGSKCQLIEEFKTYIKVSSCVTAVSVATICDVTISYLIQHNIFYFIYIKSKGSHVFVNEKGYVKSQIEYDSCDVCQNLLCMCIRYLVDYS